MKIIFKFLFCFLICLPSFAEIPKACVNLFHEHAIKMGFSQISEGKYNAKYVKNESEKILVSNSKNLGRGDTGPTASLNRFEEGWRINLLHVKNKSEGTHFRDRFYFNNSCESISKISLTRSATEQFDLDQGTCTNLKEQYSEADIVAHSMLSFCKLVTMPAKIAPSMDKLAPKDGTPAIIQN